MLFCITKVKFNLESRTIIVNVIFPVKFKIGAKQIAGAKKIKDTIGIAENIRAEFLGILRRAFYKSSLFQAAVPGTTSCAPSLFCRGGLYINGVDRFLRP